jgi:hypothetical protein
MFLAYICITFKTKKIVKVFSLYTIMYIHCGELIKLVGSNVN